MGRPKWGRLSACLPTTGCAAKVIGMPIPIGMAHHQSSCVVPWRSRERNGVHWDSRKVFCRPAEKRRATTRDDASHGKAQPMKPTATRTLATLALLATALGTAQAAVPWGWTILEIGG